jgi:hypothetical protein
MPAEACAPASQFGRYFVADGRIGDRFAIGKQVVSCQLSEREAAKGHKKRKE